MNQQRGAILMRAGLLAVIYTVVTAGSVMAATPPVPPGGGEVALTVPWAVVVGVVAVLAIAAMVRWPFTRPWIASAGSLAIAGFVAFSIVFIGSFTNFGRGGAVPMPFLIAAGAVLLVGMALSVWLAVRLRRRARAGA